MVDFLRLDFLHKTVDALLYPGGAYLFVRLVTASYAVSAIGRLIPVRRKQVPRFHRKPLRTAGIATVAVGIAVAATACTTTLIPAFRPRSARHTAAAPPAHTAPALRLGVFEPGEEATYKPVDQFAAAVGRQPDILLTYSGWHEPFHFHFADMAWAHHAEPFIQIEPVGVSLSSIVQGRSDGYLRSYADQVRAYGHPVILSFAAEANGNWYKWGWTHTPPSVWRAAWRHVVTIFRRQHATNVTWLLTFFESFPGSGPIHDYWPGAKWVNWVGIDGYYYHPRDTFASVFGADIKQIRRVTNAPILISETAVGPDTGDQARRIASLFTGIQKNHLLGLVWFDKNQYEGIYHQRWRLENNPAAVAEFRKAMKS